MSSFHNKIINDDNELVARAKAGDYSALTLLIEKYSDIIFRKASSFKNFCGVDTEDFYQEGMIGFVSSIYSFDETKGAKFSTYSSKIYVNKMLSVIRDLRSDVTHYIDSNISLDETFLQQHSALEDVLYNVELGDVLTFAKENLSKTELIVFKLYLIGVPYSQIAEVLDCSTKSIDNTIQRIRRKFREYII